MRQLEKCDGDDDDDFDFNFDNNINFGDCHAANCDNDDNELLMELQYASGGTVSLFGRPKQIQYNLWARSK